VERFLESVRGKLIIAGRNEIIRRQRQCYEYRTARGREAPYFGFVGLIADRGNRISRVCTRPKESLMWIPPLRRSCLPLKTPLQ
jgi:hypothetical protein